LVHLHGLGIKAQVVWISHQKKRSHLCAIQGKGDGYIVRVVNPGEQSMQSNRTVAFRRKKRETKFRGSNCLGVVWVGK